MRRFRIKEVEAATNRFTAVVETATGGGARGATYRARFAGGVVATVRRASAGEGRAKGEFYLEVQLLGRLNHRHVVRLHGFSEGHQGRSCFFFFASVMVQLCLYLC